LSGNHSSSDSPAKERWKWPNGTDLYGLPSAASSYFSEHNPGKGIKSLKKNPAASRDAAFFERGAKTGSESAHTGASEKAPECDRDFCTRLEIAKQV